jgi:hypothetical protein
MLRVLIPSDNQDFVGGVAHAYRRLGCDVVVGRFNFELQAAGYDLVHLQWPEEFSGWRPPSRERMNRVFALLEYWATQSKVLLTVHNLYPHGYQDNPQYFELFDGFYRRATLVHHFSRTSRYLVCSTFPSSRERRHFVTTLFNYESLRPPRADRPAARAAFQLAEDELAVLIFGALRMWKEVELIRSAWGLVSNPKKRLIMAGRYNELHPVSRGSMLYRRWSWKAWLRRQNAVVINDYIPDDQVYRLFDASDLAVVPRVEGLSSGMPSLAMTFGKLFIAPRHGAFPEYVNGTGNLLYESCDPKGLADAIETAAGLDRGQVGCVNRRMAESWSWDKIAGQCLKEALPG